MDLFLFTEIHILVGFIGVLCLMSLSVEIICSL
jgi:hypothetical protein